MGDKRDLVSVFDYEAAAREKLPRTAYDYYRSGANDEITLRDNHAAYERIKLHPRVLIDISKPDLSTTVLGQDVKMPIFVAPTAFHRMAHPEGEVATVRAAGQAGTVMIFSTLSNSSFEEVMPAATGPVWFQLYVYKDREATLSLVQRAESHGCSAIALTVDTIVGGNRERDLVTGFTSPPRLTLGSALSFATHPRWTMNYLFREKFELSQLKDYVDEGTNISLSISDYFSTMLDQSMDWKAAEEIRKHWGKQFCLKGIMSVEDARRAVDIGATAIMVSNHGGRQLDGSRAPFDQLAEIVDAVGDKVDVICDGGIQRGTHVLKALSVGAKACSGGRLYLYALAAAGQAGVEKSLSNLRAEIERGMKLMGARSVSDLSRNNLRYRNTAS